MFKIRKSNRLYIAMLTVWAGLISFTAYPFIHEIILAGNSNSPYEPLLIALLILNALFISYFWLNAVKDITYVIYYYLFRGQMNRLIRTATSTRLRRSPSIVLVYCTANDFNEHSLERSMKQKYDNFKTVILDDSSKQEYLDRVDQFAKRHDIEVIRRTDRAGFKAGNLNNYLKGRTDYDYFVILDSDEVIPSTFITSALKYFSRFSDIGVVQANHVATRNRNDFMHIFSKGVNSHWPTYQMTKHHHGFMSLLGHGAMVSRKCYEAVG